MTTPLVAPTKSSKRTSRIAAVQTAYQYHITKDDRNTIVENFIKYYIDSDDLYKDIDLFFFKKLTSHLEDDGINEILTGNLNIEYSPVLSNMIIRNIVQVAAIEIRFEKTDIPIIINEFLEISKEFVDQKSVKFINAMLDKVSKQIERKWNKKK